MCVDCHLVCVVSRRCAFFVALRQHSNQRKPFSRSPKPLTRSAPLAAPRGSQHFLTWQRRPRTRSDFLKHAIHSTGIMPDNSDDTDNIKITDPLVPRDETGAAASHLLSANIRTTFASGYRFPVSLHASPFAAPMDRNVNTVYDVCM